MINWRRKLACACKGHVYDFEDPDATRWRRCLRCGHVLPEMNERELEKLRAERFK